MITSQFITLGASCIAPLLGIARSAVQLRPWLRDQAAQSDLLASASPWNDVHGHACLCIFINVALDFCFHVLFRIKVVRNGSDAVYDSNYMTPATGTIALNNYLQVKGKLASLSWYDAPSGPAHEPEWKSDCKIDGKVIASGTGTHKHLARDAASEIALDILTKEESS